MVSVRQSLHSILFALVQMSVFGWTARFGTLPTALFVCRLACLAHRCMELLAVLAAQNRADGRNAASRNKKDVGVLPRPPTKRDSSVNDQFLVTELLSGSLPDLDGWEASPSHSEPRGSQQRTPTLSFTEQTKAVQASSPLVVHVSSPRVPPEQELCRVHTEAQSHRPFVARSRRLSGSPHPKRRDTAARQNVPWNWAQVAVRSAAEEEAQLQEKLHVLVFEEEARLRRET